MPVRDVLRTKNVVTNFVDIVEKLIASKKDFAKCFDDAVAKIERSNNLYESQFKRILDEIKRKRRPKIV